MSLKEVDLKNYTAKFTSGSRINLDANKVYKELCEIQNNNEEGNLLPEEVLEWAKNHPLSELYKGIDWDDSIAAQKWRLQQCTKIIYNIRIVPGSSNMEDIKEDNTPLRQDIQIVPFMHIDGVRGYQSTVQIVNNEDKYDQLKKQAYRDLESWRSKYQMITELKDLFDEIDTLLINE